MLDAAGAHELAPALEAGLLTLTPVATLGGSVSDIVDVFAKNLSELLTNSNRHLLLDDQIAGIANALVREGLVSPSPLALANAGEAAVAHGLIARLPAFDTAPTDEILDLRRDLDLPLKRYRRAVAEMSARLRSGPLDGDIAAEIDHLYLHEVEPALAEIREGMADHGLVREIARTLALDIKPLITGAVGSVIALSGVSLANLGTLVAATAGSAPLGLAATAAAAQAVIEKQKGEAASRSHELFYLFEVDRRLSQ